MSNVIMFIINSCEYDVPRPSLDTYDTPRMAVAAPAAAVAFQGEEYDVPARFKRLSDRSSGVSLLSSGSSGSSALSNVTSLSSESLSLSSALGVGATSSNVSGTSSISGRSSTADTCDAACGSQQQNELYDVPKAAADTYDVPVSKLVVLRDPAPPAADHCLYDVPAPTCSQAEPPLYDVPASAVPCPSGSSAHSVEAVHTDAQDTYDVPPPSSGQAVTTDSDTYDWPKPQAHDLGSTYDAPRSLDLGEIKSSLPLSLDSALETLERLDTEVSSALVHLFRLWRGQEAALGDIQQTELQLRVMRLRASLQELIDFAKGAIGNACQLKSGDDQVAIRLSRLLRPLQDASTIVQRTSYSWTVNARRRPNSGPNELDQLVACCRNLNDDVRLVTPCNHHQNTRGSRLVN